VRFGDEQEQLSALGTMDGKTGLGDRPIKVSTAYAKGTNFGGGGTQSNSYGYGSSSTPSSYGGAAQTGGQEYSAQWAQYNQYWAQYNAWQQYYAANPGALQQGQEQLQQQEGHGQSSTLEKVTENETNELKNTVDTKLKKENDPENVKTSILDGNAKEPVDNKMSINFETFDKEFFVQSEEMYWAIENSRWWYHCSI